MRKPLLCLVIFHAELLIINTAGGRYKMLDGYVIANTAEQFIVPFLFLFIFQRIIDYFYIDTALSLVFIEILYLSQQPVKVYVRPDTSLYLPAVNPWIDILMLSRPAATSSSLIDCVRQ